MKNLFLTFTLSLLSWQIAFTQLSDTTLARYSATFTHEKAYLHLDKAVYFPGETIWFKAYVMEDLFPAERSKTLYVDWVTSDGNVLMHTVAPVVNGITNGQLDIPLETAPGIIHVRAYTSWMLNFDTAFLFKKEIQLLDKNGKNLKTPKPAAIPSLSFFPEGGDMIAGASNRVAFKATDQWGMPVKIKGTVVTDKGVLVDSIKTEHDGMGSFLIKPEEEIVYTVKWKDEKNTGHTSRLPPSKSTGVAMQVAMDGTKRIISFSASLSLSENLQQIHLIGTIGGQMAFRNDISITAASIVKRVIPTESLPSGLLSFTLFDANWNAIAERITFVNNHDYSFETSMEVLHWGLGKRKRNEIEIRLPDSLANASLSISVTDASIEKDSNETIISHFLLSSEIKGYVHNPAYYFAGNDEIREKNLDLVMLTNGWRRFKWEEITKGKLPKISSARDTNYLSLSGQLMGVSKSQLSGKESIVLLIKEKDSSSKMQVMPINRDGTFGDPSFVFFDSLNVYYSLKSKMFAQAEAKFMTNRLPTPNYSDFAKGLKTYKPFTDTAGLGYHYNLASKEISLKEFERNKVMETVIIKTKQKPTVQVMEDKYASGMFKGGDGVQFDLVNDPLASAYLNVFNYLQGKVAGLQISTGPEPTLTWRGGSPQLYLDQMQVDASMVSSVPVNDIAYIKVFRPPFMGGFGGGAGGAIAIYTKRGDDATNTGKGGLTSSKILGYTPIREFYSPNYDRFDARNQQADVRTTLYWNPGVITTSKKPAVKLVFYNNDVTKSFRVVIEGMTSSGFLTHLEQVME